MRQKHFARIQLSPASRGLDRLRARFAMPLYALAGLAGLVVLRACANLGNLLIARGVGRAREFAIRVAAGATGGRMFRQLLTETILLLALGTLAGLAVARIAIEVLRVTRPLSANGAVHACYGVCDHRSGVSCNRPLRRVELRRRSTPQRIRCATGTRRAAAQLASAVLLGIAPQVAIGIIVGLPVAHALARMADRMLFGVRAADLPITS